MSRFYRIFLFGVALLALAGCSQYTFGSGQSDVETIEDTTVTRTLQYFDNNDEGPRYNVSLDLPEEWVGQFETRNEGNSLAFRYLVDEDDEQGSPLFYVEALSNAQYWEQIGSYPGQYFNIANTADTYFIYYLPVDAYYSGLNQDEFDALAAIVPDIVESVEVVRR